jgi:hypothetical protein
MAVLLVIASLALPQQSLSTFAGSWIAEHNGTVFIRLALQETNGTIQGEVGTGGFKVNDKGDISEVTAITGPSLALSKFSLKEGVLTFFRMGDNDSDEFRLTLTADGEAELTFHLSEETLEQLEAEGIPLPRPLKLRKAG